MNNVRSSTEPRRVTRIPDLLVNQIAAGEVVERPASALKEIVENSLDAGSRRIEVHLKDGGIKEITVLDDGVGIHPEDLPLCLERHATSKIHKALDLEAIGTYGFRGEALASIASVAEVELRSRPREYPRALSLCVRFGQTEDPKPLGAPVGTFVAVRDLFDRLPARQKFLRRPPTEFSHCARVIRELAVGNPQVSFHLHHQGRLVCSYTAPTRLGRIEEAFCWDWKPVHLEETGDGVHLEAFLSPSDRFSDRTELLLFINQRAVRNRGLLAAVRQAYLSTVGPHHEPSGVVYLDIRKDWVDVNVHPQKTEVRCLRQESLYSWILSAVRKSVSQNPSLRQAHVAPTPTAVLSPVPQRPLPSPLFESRVAAPQQPFLIESVQPEPVVPVQNEPMPLATPARWKYLGQVRASYLLCEDSEGLVLVDQHALHEKIRYEQLQKQNRDQALKSQRLLLPKVLRLEPEWLELLEETAPKLGELGFELESFGDGDWAIKALPLLVSESQAERFLREALSEIRKQGQAPGELAQAIVNPVLATVACHSVVRAGQTLGSLQAQSLVDQMAGLEMGWTCPHGRPVAFRLAFGEIEKHFERK